MKTFLNLIKITLTIVFILFLLVFTRTNKDVTKNDKDNLNKYFKTVNYNKHSYIIYSDKTNNKWGILYSPDCNCIKDK